MTLLNKGLPMLVVDEQNKTVLLDNVTTPIFSTHFWVLDLKLVDFMLTPIAIIEELVSDSVTIEMPDGFQFAVPATWHILISDPETSTLDVIEAQELAVKPFHIVIYDNEKSFVYCVPAKVVDKKLNDLHIYPSVKRHQMLCHPISICHWAILSPTDVYVKYIKDFVIGDLI